MTDEVRDAAKDMWQPTPRADEHRSNMLLWLQREHSKMMRQEIALRQRELAMQQPTAQVTASSHNVPDVAPTPSSVSQRTTWADQVEEDDDEAP